MKSINFNTGIKKYAVNGDENNAISINISDLNLYKRIMEADTAFDPFFERLDREENTPELLFEVDKAVKEKLDSIFNAKVSEKAFGDTNCLSTLEDGNLLLMAFLEAFIPMVLEDINKNHKEFNANTKLSKYLPPEEKKPAPDLSKLTPEQLAYLASIGMNT